MDENEIYSVERRLLRECIKETPNILIRGAFDVVVAILNHNDFHHYQESLDQLITNPSLLEEVILLEDKIRSDVEREVEIEVHAPDFDAALTFIHEAENLFPKG